MRLPLPLRLRLLLHFVVLLLLLLLLLLQSPVLPVNEPKKTGVRTRGQNSPVINIVQVYMGWLYTIDALCRLSKNTYSQSSTLELGLLEHKVLVVM
jgi:hypothetical protein